MNKTVKKLLIKKSTSRPRINFKPLFALLILSRAREKGQGVSMNESMS
jgi:hypothetical protein